MTSLALKIPGSILAAVFLALLPAGGFGDTSANASVAHNCGKVVNSYVLTEQSMFLTNSTAFTEVTGASQTISIPDGTSRCVKVTFSAMTACNPTAKYDGCLIDVFADGTELDPAVGGGILYDQENPEWKLHSFEFVKRLEAGTHTIRVKASVVDPATSFSIGARTMDVEISK
jgi:hypothetical protein